MIGQVHSGVGTLTAVETTTFTVAELPEIDLETFHGAIEIHSWDRAEVEVEIEKLAMEPSLIEQIKVETTHHDNTIMLKVTGRDGSILADAVDGTIVLETDNGRIGFAGKPSALRLKTGDGSVRAQIDSFAVMADNWDLATGDGRVTLTLPSIFSAELDAATEGGSVRSSHPLVDDGRTDRHRGENGEERRARRRVMRVTMGDGGKTLRVRTGDGTIRIER